MENVAGKVAFVTGGASGLGLAMVRSFTAAGMKVAIADIEDSALESAASEFAESNADVICLKVDVTDRDAMEQAKQDTLSAFGNVHVVCNNAGVAISGNITEMGYKDWDWVMKVNLDGVVNGIVTFLEHIKSHGEGGHFVNTASIAGQYGMPGLSVYNGTKFAVVGISESMRIDLADLNIGISVLCPGVVATNIFNSERNRPGSQPGEKPTFFANEDLSEEEREARIKERMMTVMDPALIGDMVLHAIQTNEFYILSHEEFRGALENRAKEISESFTTWDKFRKDHSS